MQPLAQRATDLWSSWKAFEGGFDCAPMQRWMMDHLEIPTAIAIGYVIFVFAGQAFMRGREPVQLKNVFTVWNLILSVFSIAGAIAVCPFFIQMLLEKGERYMYCTPGAETHLFGPSGFWICAFCLSKIPELMDTVFLVIRKRPVIFLHWWHHTTVMLFCWYGHMLGINVGPWFAAMNYFVHSIMYTYYFGMSAGEPFRSIVKPFAMAITILQLVQMVFGLYVTVRIQLILDYSEDGASCQAHRTLNLAGLGMYLSYFVLFGNFFYHNYIKAGGRKRAGGAAAKPKAE